MENKDSGSLANVITAAVRLPGVKVDRTAFLREVFQDAEPERLGRILQQGPADGGCSKEELRRLAQKQIHDRTVTSSGISLMTGFSGGLAIAAAIPADVLQFYGFALRLAQELAYLYGEPDLWSGPDEERAAARLMLYCGAMFDVPGGVQGVRLTASPLARQAAAELPPEARTKAFYAPVFTAISRQVGSQMTKESLAKGVVKLVPVLGGIVSGGITMTTMRPMGRRLTAALERARFAYSRELMRADWSVIVTLRDEELARQAETEGEAWSGTCEAPPEEESPLKKIEQAKELLDAGIITEREFAMIKAKLIAKL